MLLLKYMLVYERGLSVVIVFFFKQNTSYELRISDWSSDVCSSDLSSCRYNIVTRAANRRQAGLCGRHVWKKSPPGRPGGAGNCGNLLRKMPFSRRLAVPSALLAKGNFRNSFRTTIRPPCCAAGGSDRIASISLGCRKVRSYPAIRCRADRKSTHLNPSHY